MAVDAGLGLDTSSYLVHGARFEVPKQYTVLELVGQGAYGIVCSARDEETRESIAVKKVANTFERLTFAKRTLREMRILRHLRHENLIGLRYAFLPGIKETYEDIYIVFDLMENNLAEILRSGQPLSEEHCQYFLYQILRGLKYLHSAEVIHRDLKPRNLLVNSNCDLKICDYGLARLSPADDEFRVCPMTQYVCTRWYRAPEVLCSWRDYGKAIDVWSVGCIFAEMLNRTAIFPGRSTQQQLSMIISCLGTPDAAALERIPDGNCRRFIESLPATGGRPLAEMVADASCEALDVLDKTLRLSPDRRITAEQALQLPFLGELHCPEDEPGRPPLDASDFEFERRKMDMAGLREEIFLEALCYHPQQHARYLEEQARLGGYSISNYRLLAPGEHQSDGEEEEAAAG